MTELAVRTGRPAASPAARGRRKRFGRALVVAAAVIVLVLAYFPFLVVVSNSLKSAASLARSGPFSFFTSFAISNYAVAASGIGGYLLNTVIVGIISVAIGVPCSALAAYAFATTNFRGKEVLFYLYLGLLLIPWTLTLIPLFVEVKGFGMFDSWGALILPYAASSQPLLLFLNRTFFEGIPGELLQSARVDGARELQVLVRIVVPLAKPILLTGVVLMAISVWGDYLWPTIVITTDSKLTISAGLQNFVGSFGLSGRGGGAVFAAYVITTVPLFALVAVTMKHFLAGVTAGAGKL